MDKNEILKIAEEQPQQENRADVVSNARERMRQIRNGLATLAQENRDLTAKYRENAAKQRDLKKEFFRLKRLIVNAEPDLNLQSSLKKLAEDKL